MPTIRYTILTHQPNRTTCSTLVLFRGVLRHEFICNILKSVPSWGYISVTRLSAHKVICILDRPGWVTQNSMTETWVVTCHI